MLCSCPLLNQNSCHRPLPWSVQRMLQWKPRLLRQSADRCLLVLPMACIDSSICHDMHSMLFYFGVPCPRACNSDLQLQVLFHWTWNMPIARFAYVRDLLRICGLQLLHNKLYASDIYKYSKPCLDHLQFKASLHYSLTFANVMLIVASKVAQFASSES